MQRQPSVRELAMYMGSACSDKRRLMAFVRTYHDTAYLQEALRIVRQYLKTNEPLFPFLGAVAQRAALGTPDTVHSIYIAKIEGAWTGVVVSSRADVEPLFIRCGGMALTDSLAHIGAVIDLN